jgi:hypothetical protein
VTRRFVLSGLTAGALAVGGLIAGLPGASAMPAHPGVGVHAVHVCTTHPKPGHAACLAMAVVGADGKVVTGTRADPLVGFHAADVQKAYHLKGLQADGRTVAIVDAFGYSHLQSDLAQFRKMNNLPACTRKTGCLRVLDQRGGHNYPPDNARWDPEQALDVDMVSAACPTCTILMVQADKSTFKSLEAAENTAAKQPGVVAISNSYGGGQGSNSPAYDHPGIAVTASTGDSGYAPANLYPASDTNVVAVGGTSVFKDGSRRGYHETAWSGAGSGCSTTNPAPKWQQQVNTSCGQMDATADVAAAADPGNGGLVIVLNGHTAQYGGTSEASPLIAAVFALSGRTTGHPAKYLYADPQDLHDITSGRNGGCGSPLCRAGNGWDGPTGLGTPHGVAAS